MRSARLPLLILVALLVLCFGLAAWLDLWFQSWQGNRAQSADLLNVLLGDSRRMFANHFFVKADAYFHSGFYPSVFDNREAFQTPHMAEDSGTVGGHNRATKKASSASRAIGLTPSAASSSLPGIPISTRAGPREIWGAVPRSGKSCRGSGSPLS